MLIDNDARSSYTPKELSVLNLLKHPVWVFDIERKRMFWANTSALEVWNAESLDALLQRDYSSDMSEAAEARMRDNLATISRGGTVQEQWTFYPQGKGAKTVSLTATGIRIDGGRVAALAETELPDKEAFKDDTVRGMEMLRHLPFAVSQFSLEGKLIYQNPEAVSTFGTLDNKNCDNTDSAVTVGAATEPSCDFENQFVDKNIGKTALKQVQEGTEFNAEAQHPTTHGSRWFSTSLRRTRDPVTSEFVILQSARDISEIIEARQETTRAAMKSEFMAVMAHEIRTPLHQMVGYLDLLSLTCLDAEQNDLFTEIRNSTSMLMSIINDLLDYTKLDCGRLQIENVNFALDGLIQGCLAAIRPEATRKTLTLRSHVGHGVLKKLVGDPNRLRQILLNLLSNALKFTNHGSINLLVSHVESTDDSHRLRFDVMDTGIGIERNEQESLFKKYNQANASVARQYGGTGLGLAICKGLCELMDGTIGLTSKIGDGSTFFFEIPFQVPALSQESSILGKRPAVYEEINLSILVVEDNLVNQKMMSQMLIHLGHQVTIAENGLIALEKINQGDFDLILMDVQMPVMDGIECTKTIRSELGFNKIMLPIVGLTAGFQNSDLHFYQDAGMTSCVGKPLKLEQLRLVILEATTVKSI